MGSNMEEAVRAKSFAEKQFLEKNFVGAQKSALEAQTLCPELDGISQMVLTFGVYVASETLATINGELDFYSILGLNPSVGKSKIKKRYKKMAVLLHPDKNKTVGADGAFRLVSEAWTLLSDIAKRNSYDQRRSVFAAAGAYENSSKLSSTHERLDTFWTVCTSCHVQYEYLRKYVSKRLSCKNCRGVFIAVETGLAPLNATFQYNSYSYAPDNGYGNLGCGVTCAPTIGYSEPNGVSGHHTGCRSEYVSNISFQVNSSGNSVGISDPKANGKHQLVKATGHVGSSRHTDHNEASRSRRVRSAKKRKVELGTSYPNDQEEVCPNILLVPRRANGNRVAKPASKFSSTSETTRRCSASPDFDGRKLLIDKARSEIRRKLEEVGLAAEAAAAEAERRNALAEVDNQPQLKRTVSMSMTVPDSDFHDFDKDRSEECFNPKQIWALYDEEDGMPRLYCIIREVISVKPFKIYISYLGSKTDTNIGSVNWSHYGFTKSCGSFRVFHSETVEQVNIFSHLLGREKAGRGGCVRIYPRSGDIWVVYRYWSPDWNKTSRDEIRERDQYEMVEVLDDFSEENGVRVTPVIKVDGFKTVYQRNTDKDAIRWIPKREMLRFSHQVPSYSLKVEGANLPEGCWDLDPAATPDEFLQGGTGHLNKISEEKVNQSEICASIPDQGTQVVCVEERTFVELPQGECRIKATDELP